MKLTKLPDSCDPNLLIQEKNRAIYSICPCCGESRKDIYCLMDKLEKGEYGWPGDLYGGVERINYVPSKGWYGPAKGDWLGWVIPGRKHRWRIDCYRCHTCGAEWESDPYPDDIGKK